MSDVDIPALLEAIRQHNSSTDRLAQGLEKVAGKGSASTVTQVVMPPPTDGERAVHRVEKYFVAMVVLNMCMGCALVLNWITDTNQTHVINAIYMMAPGLQKQIEAKKDVNP